MKSMFHPKKRQCRIYWYDYNGSKALRKCKNEGAGVSKKLRTAEKVTERECIFFFKFLIKDIDGSIFSIMNNWHQIS